jgi:hypothetical protein
VLAIEWAREWEVRLAQVSAIELARAWATALVLALGST